MSKVAKPLIGINMEYRDGAENSFSCLSAGYYDGILKAGGIPVLLAPLESEEDIDRILDVVDGVVLCGGADMDCRKDGWELHHSMRILAARRERFDRRLATRLSERMVPVLGIGVGMQLLNVVGGGTLHLHIPEDKPKALPHRDMTDKTHGHRIVVTDGTFMDRVYAESDELKGRRSAEREIRVTSQHHMAVDDVARGFTATARCPDGIIEAIESTGEWLAIGVQFHPESVGATLLDQSVFDEFVLEVSRRSKSNELTGVMAVA